MRIKKQINRPIPMPPYNHEVQCDCVFCDCWWLVFDNWIHDPDVLWLQIYRDLDTRVIDSYRETLR